MASTIKVDNVQNQPGTNIVNKCGTTVNVGAASDNIRSAGNNLQASDGGNLISQSGTTVTLGASGDTVTLASGASQSGFGRAGSVDWDTASIKTATFTAVSGNGYFCDTTSGIFNITLPTSPTAGDIVALKDYAGTFATNNLTIDRGGSKLDGNAGNRVLNTDSRSLTLVYVDSTQGWKSVEEGTGYVGATPAYVTATGGTPCSGAICGDYKTHTFTGPGAFCVSCGGNPGGNNQVDYLIVAGGGGGAGGGDGGGVGGAGAGGVRVGTVCASPTIPMSAGGYTVSATPYAIVVGGGGANNPSLPANTAGASGSCTTGLGFTATGGGGGNDAGSVGATGGSGGGGGEGGGTGGAGNTPPVSPAQGFPGGSGASTCVAAGGGSITEVGGSSPPTAGPGLPAATGAGGNGQDFGPVFGTGNGTPGGFFAGGGGGSKGGPSVGSPTAPGGGGVGGSVGSSSTSGGTNTGGGGGGNGSNNPGGTNGGGSGIVIIRYKFQ